MACVQGIGDPRPGKFGQSKRNHRRKGGQVLCRRTKSSVPSRSVSLQVRRYAIVHTKSNDSYGQSRRRFPRAAETFGAVDVKAARLTGYANTEGIASERSEKGHVLACDILAEGNCCEPCGAYFVSCTNARLAAWVGMDLNDFPARSCSWSSTLFSHVEKLTLTEAIAERMVRAMEIASCTLDIAPMGLKPDIAISTLALAILYPITNFSPPLIPYRALNLPNPDSEQTAWCSCWQSAAPGDLRLE